jgi:oligopeptide transport system substrate-binding protein
MVLVLATIGVLGAAGSRLDAGDDTSGAARGAPAAGKGGTLTIAFGSAPQSLDPAFATDRTAATLVLAVMDPLVRLGPELEVEPALARSWSVSANGRRVTFELRENATWTNGDPVTADDVVFAWRRVLSPSLDSPLVRPLLAVRGAAAYHACERSCARLADRVGVRANGPHELVVDLARPTPWFVRSTGLPALVPVHRRTVLVEGEGWTRPGTIVSNGPFVLGDLTADAVSLVRNPRFRTRRAVGPARIEGRFIADAGARVRAFDAGTVAALDGSPLPSTDLPALQEREELELYPTLASELYAFNFTTISDVHQRRAMALAVNREGLEQNVTQDASLPATDFLPAGAPLQGRKLLDSRWLPAAGDVAGARSELELAAVVKRRVTIIHPNRPGARNLAVYLRSAWSAIGIDATIRAQDPDSYLDFRGPLGPDGADLYAISFRPEVPEAWSSLALWTCRSPANKTNFCNGRFDRLVAAARVELDPVVRADMLLRAEQVLSGLDGAMPAVPLVWGSFPNLESLAVKETFAINPLGQIQLARVDVR